MTPELRRMAEEAMKVDAPHRHGTEVFCRMQAEHLEAFARLVAADCAAICEDEATYEKGDQAPAAKDAILRKYRVQP